jgi:alanine-glyoxylate transaminase/serine-glyoxylate transaminase/serine-pyruvate transaminase
MLCRCGLIRSAQALCPLYGHIVDFFNAFFQEKMFDIDNASRGPVGEIDVPKRYLMGPGPANADPRVLTAQALPLLGHMHPPFLKIMDEVQQGLRYLFQTSSPYTLCVSGTGHAGMEAAIANLVEPGETVIVGNKGIWVSFITKLPYFLMSPMQNT